MKIIIITVFSIIPILWVTDNREYYSIPGDIVILKQIQDTTSMAYWKDRAIKAELTAEQNALIAQANAEEAMHQREIAQKAVVKYQEKIKELEAIIEEQGSIIEILKKKNK